MLTKNNQNISINSYNSDTTVEFYNKNSNISETKLIIVTHFYSKHNIINDYLHLWSSSSATLILVTTTKNSLLLPIVNSVTNLKDLNSYTVLSISYFQNCEKLLFWPILRNWNWLLVDFRSQKICQNLNFLHF